jgi:hypothetical protein
MKATVEHPVICPECSTVHVEVWVIAGIVWLRCRTCGYRCKERKG